MYLNLTQEQIRLISHNYKLASKSMLDFLSLVWENQGKTKLNCTGMASFSFVPERLTFDGTNDCIIPAYKWDTLREGV